MGSNQTDGQTGFSGTTCTADTMNIFITFTRQIVVNHQIHPFNVQTTCCNISGDQNVALTFTQRLHHIVTLVLGHIAMQHSNTVTVTTQKFVQTLYLNALIHKDNGFIVSLIGQQPHQ